MKNDDTIELTEDEFRKLNHLIRSKLSKINSKGDLFVDKNNEEPNESLFID